MSKVTQKKKKQKKNKEEVKDTKKYILTIECGSESILADVKSFLFNDGDQNILCMDKKGEKAYYPEITEVHENKLSITCDYKHEWQS